jgi:hypothetical protein
MSRDVVVVCSCNKKSGSSAQFVVLMADKTQKIVASEQEARALVRINGGSYSVKR